MTLSMSHRPHLRGDGPSPFLPAAQPHPPLAAALLCRSRGPVDAGARGGLRPQGDQEEEEPAGEGGFPAEFEGGFCCGPPAHPWGAFGGQGIIVYYSTPIVYQFIDISSVHGTSFSSLAPRMHNKNFLSTWELSSSPPLYSSQKGPTDSPSVEDEMGLAGAAAEDIEADLVRKVCEFEVGGVGLLSWFEPIIVAVVTNPSKYPCPTLQASASLALAKFMLIR